MPNSITIAGVVIPQNLEFKTPDYLWIISNPRFHVIIKMLVISLQTQHYLPIGMVMKHLKFEQVREVIEICINDKEQARILSYLFATAEGQTELNDYANNDNLVFIMRDLFFLVQYAGLAGIQLDYKSLSLFDTNKKIYKQFTLQELLDKFHTTNHEEFMSFLKEIRDDDGKEKQIK